MNSCTVLPEGYKPVLHIDLQKDKRLALLVNGLALLIGVILFGIAVCFVPVDSFMDFANPGMMLWKLAVLCGGIIGYVILHEAVHGVVMRHYCEAKVKFGFTGLYAYAGSEGYYCRRHYIIIALAPIVFWGAVLLLVNFLVPPSWFYVVYWIQVMNLSGAAGDLYVSWKMHKMPPDILVQDTGVEMTVFGRMEEMNGI